MLLTVALRNRAYLLRKKTVLFAQLSSSSLGRYCWSSPGLAGARKWPIAGSIGLAFGLSSLNRTLAFMENSTTAIDLNAALPEEWAQSLELLGKLIESVSEAVTDENGKKFQPDHPILLNLMLLYLYHESVQPDKLNLGFSIPSESLRFLQYSIAAYGDEFSAKEALVKGIETATVSAILAKVDSVRKEDICEVALYQSSVQEEMKGVYRPKYFICVDHKTHSVVLSIRGTANPADTLKDLLCHSHDFLDGKAHFGIARAAEMVYKDSMTAVAAALDKNEGYKLVLCGHSLGAGTALLLNLLIHERLQKQKQHTNDQKIPQINIKTKVYCYAFAPPPVYEGPVDSAAAADCHCFIHHDDLVPRLSLGAAVGLLQAVRALDALPLSQGDRLSAVAVAHPAVARALAEGLGALDQAKANALRELGELEARLGRSADRSLRELEGLPPAAAALLAPRAQAAAGRMRGGVAAARAEVERLAAAAAARAAAPTAAARAGRDVVAEAVAALEAGAGGRRAAVRRRFGALGHYGTVHHLRRRREGGEGEEPGGGGEGGYAVGRAAGDVGGGGVDDGAAAADWMQQALAPGQSGGAALPDLLGAVASAVGQGGAGRHAPPPRLLLRRSCLGDHLGGAYEAALRAALGLPAAPAAAAGPRRPRPGALRGGLGELESRLGGLAKRSLEDLRGLSRRGGLAARRELDELEHRLGGLADRSLQGEIQGLSRKAKLRALRELEARLGGLAGPSLAVERLQERVAILRAEVEREAAIIWRRKGS